MNENYTYILENFKDEKIKNYFIELTEKSHLEWTEDIYNSINMFIKKDFDELDNNLKMLLLFYPECWLFYIKDEDFIEYIKQDWNDLTQNINDFFKTNHLKNGVDIETFRNRVENIKKLKRIMSILQEIYPDQFKLNFI